MAVRALQNYATSPPIDGYAPAGVTGDKGLLRYVYDCTRTDDRVWILSDIYSFPYYSQRRPVRHIYWSMGFQASPRMQRRTIEMLEQDEVPIIMGVGGRRPLEFLEPYDLVHEYVDKRYRERIPLVEDKLERGLVIWMLFDSRRVPSGTHKPLELPCFK
jgi:hypothetical protein